MDPRGWMWTGALLLVLSTPALADSAKERAAALFQQGRAAMERDELSEACPKFAESAKLEPAPGTLLNLALCQEGLGQVGSALTNYRVVIALLPPSDERVPFAKEHAEVLELRVARLKVVLAPGAPADATVLQDGAEIARADLGAADPVDPGDHEVILRIPGQQDIVTRVSLGEGERRTLVIKPPVRDIPVREAPFPTRTVGLILGGVGVASLTAGLITGGLVLDKKATVDASCHGTAVCDTQEGIDAAAAGSTLSTISTITFVAGTALLGAGVVLFVMGDAPGEATSAGVAAVPGGGVLRLGRTF